MASPGPRPWPTAVLGSTVVLAAASVVLSLGREPVHDTVLYAGNAVALGVAGFLVVTQHPGHRVGLLLGAVGAQGGVVELAEGYGYHLGWAGAPTATWIATWGSFFGIGATLVLPAVFPTGRVPTPRWVPVLWACAIGVVLSAAGAATGRVLDGRYPPGGNPYALPGPWPELVFGAGQCALVVALVGGVASMVVRYRRAGATERLQLRWLLLVLGALAVVGPPALFLYDRSALVQWLIGLVVMALPVAVCTAVLRYRLYDIDVLVSRTLVYLALTGVIAAAWLSTAAVLGALVGRHPPWVTAGATVAACGLVLPVRRRLQDLVDRRFRRARHDALARVDTHLEDLRTGRATPEQLEPLLREVLAAPDLRLRYVLPGDEVPDGAADTDGSAGATRTVVQRAGTALAVVTAPGPASPLWDVVLARAGLAIEIARLGAEVAHRLDEVSRSRARIVEAGHAERRRLERDLHDGAQQRLVAVGLALRHAQHRLGPSPVGAALDEAVDQVGAAIADLRGIAAGMRPSGLDDGLIAALLELAGRTPMPVELDLDLDRHPGPCPAAVEASAWFVASEAITNAVKHARAGSLHLRAAREGVDLVLEVGDDGVGGADPARGSGLRGLSDRVAAIGGELRICSPPGGGTTLVARLPCGS